MDRKRQYIKEGIFATLHKQPFAVLACNVPVSWQGQAPDRALEWWLAR